MQISFHFLQSCVLSNRNDLRAFLHFLTKKEKTKIESIDIIFCDDEYLHTLNVQHLNHDTLTDIITFDLTQNKFQPKIAELYISVPRVKENAKIFKTTIKKELHRVIFHGTLHLCGYKDKKPNEVKLMREKEDVYLNLYFNKPQKR